MSNSHPRGFVLWFTGLSGAGKSTLATLISQALNNLNIAHEVLDGDVVRTHLSKGLGFSKEDRDTNIRRIGFVANLLVKHHVPVIVAAISPYRDVRNEVRETIGPERFVEVYVEAALATLIERDVKGLYKKAIAGEIPNFTGVNDPYEAPHNPDVTVNTGTQSIAESAAAIWSVLVTKGFVFAPNPFHTDAAKSNSLALAVR